jgi:hypothetical protein
MSYDPEDVPPRKRTGRRASTKRIELEPWFKELDPGGFRYSVDRIYPVEEFVCRQHTKIERHQLEEAGAGIYEITCETKNAQGTWVAAQAPKRIEISDQKNPRPTNGNGPFQAYMMERLRQADRSTHQGPAQNSRALEDIERTYRDRTEDLKRDNADRLEQQRMTWGDRLEMSRNAHRSEVQMWETRVRELEERCRRVEDELREARSKQKDSLSTTLETLSAFEQLQPFIGAEKSSPWSAVFAEVLKNKDAIGDVIGSVVPGMRLPGGTPPQQIAPAPAATPPAPTKPKPELLDFANVLERLFVADVSPVDTYQQLAPTLPREALSAIGEASGDEFVGEILKSCASSSKLVTAAGTQWLNDLHGIVKKLFGPQTANQEAGANELDTRHDPSDGAPSEAGSG